MRRSCRQAWDSGRWPRGRRRPRRRGDAERADRDDHGVAGADLGVLLRPVGLLDVHGADQLGLQGVALDACVESVDGNQPLAADGFGLDLAVGGEQGGVRVTGRGRGAEVAADAAAVADLRGGDGVRGERQTGQLGPQVLHDAAVRHGGAEPYVLLAHLPLGQLTDPVQVQEVLGPPVVEVDLDHDIGAARDGHSRGVLGLGGERLLPAGGAKEVHEWLSSRSGVRRDWGRPARDWRVHVVFTWCVAQYTSRAPAGAVTETPKELAGLRPRLVDSNEWRRIVISP
ncbi:hypothetical protein SCALM49S_02157 [Streptomyces californicus]